MKTNTCLICNCNSSDFLSTGSNSFILKEKRVIGGGFRHNVVCPNCRSNDRERLLHLYLLHKTGVFNNKYKMLHIAPEKRLTNILKCLPNLDYITADLYMESAMIKMDITNIPFDSNMFDFIICNHVLEHIIDDIKAMSELYRVLKKEGQAILQVPISHILEQTYEDEFITDEISREIHFGQYDHVRIYADDYILRLKQVGFKVDTFDWTTEEAMFGGINNIYNLNKEELIYIVTK